MYSLKIGRCSPYILQHCMGELLHMTEEESTIIIFITDAHMMAGSTTLEGDALQEMTATLNEGISEQGTLNTFGDAMSSANFVSPQTVRYAMSKGGDSDYVKVSNIMSAVKSHISTQSTQEKVTRRFNEFVILLHNLGLENLAQLLVERLRKNSMS